MSVCEVNYMQTLQLLSAGKRVASVIHLLYILVYITDKCHKAHPILINQDTIPVATALASYVQSSTIKNK